MGLSLWFLIGCFSHISIISFHLWCMLGGSDSEWRATCFGSLRAKLILAPLGMPNQVQLLIKQYRSPSFKPPHYLQTWTQNFTKPGRFCVWNNQLLTQVKLEINSNMWKVLLSSYSCWRLKWWKMIWSVSELWFYGVDNEPIFLSC